MLKLPPLPEDLANQINGLIDDFGLTEIEAQHLKAQSLRARFFENPADASPEITAYMRVWYLEFTAQMRARDHILTCLGIPVRSIDTAA